MKVVRVMLGSQKKIVKVALLFTCWMTGLFPHKHSEKNAKKHTHTRQEETIYIKKENDFNIKIDRKKDLHSMFSNTM